MQEKSASANTSVFVCTMFFQFYHLLLNICLRVVVGKLFDFREWSSYQLYVSQEKSRCAIQDGRCRKDLLQRILVCRFILCSTINHYFSLPMKNIQLNLISSFTFF